MENLLKLDLQLFAEDDFILPDDFVDETVQSETEETEVTEVEETTETEATEETTSISTPTIKVKYNSEEKEITVDEARVLAQKGMNYDKLQEKLNQLQSDPSITFLEQQAKRHNMTTEQYIQAWQAEEEQRQLNELVEKNIPEEYAKEVIENRKFREDFKQKETQQQEEQRKQQEMQDFVTEFPGLKGEDIKPETWVKVQQGMPIKYAYLEQVNQELQTKVKVVEQNNKNKEKAPIKGVTNHGSEDVGSNDAFLDGFDSID